MSVQDAAASLAGSASVSAASVVLTAAVVAISGLAATTAAASVHAKAATALTGQSSTTFTVSVEGPLARASLFATGLFYIDPTKVLLIPFFKATAVPPQYQAPQVPAIRPQAPGNSASSYTISLTSTPPKTQTGGVPNEG